MSSDYSQLIKNQTNLVTLYPKAIVVDDIDIKGDLQVDGNLKVDGTTQLVGAVTIDNNVNVTTGSVVVQAGNVDVTGNLQVSANANILNILADNLRLIALQYPNGINNYEPVPVGRYPLIATVVDTGTLPFTLEYNQGAYGSYKTITNFNPDGTNTPIKIGNLQSNMGINAAQVNMELAGTLDEIHIQVTGQYLITYNMQYSANDEAWVEKCRIFAFDGTNVLLESSTDATAGSVVAPENQSASASLSVSGIVGLFAGNVLQIWYQMAIFGGTTTDVGVDQANFSIVKIQ